MAKIVNLSEFGFKLNTDPEKWVSCDNKFIISKEFKSLKIGDELTKFIYNSKDFLTGVTVLCIKAQEGGVTRQTLNTINRSLTPPPSCIKNGLIYGQCVNLAFHHVSTNECGLNIVEAFDLADKIYIEYLKRC